MLATRPVCTVFDAASVCNKAAKLALLLLLNLPHISASQLDDRTNWYCVELLRMPMPCTSDNLEMVIPVLASSEGKRAAPLCR